jgi:hypothetical protein
MENSRAVQPLPPAFLPGARMYSAGHNEAGGRRVDLAIDNAVPSPFPEVEIVERRFVHEGPNILRDTSAWTQPNEE